MKDKEFDIKMEKVSDAPDKSSSKYAIIGYFRAKQQSAAVQAAPRQMVNQKIASSAASEKAVAESANPQAIQSAVKEITSKPSKHDPKQECFCILSKSTAEQWLLELIAFLLFIHLLCKA